MSISWHRREDDLSSILIVVSLLACGVLILLSAVMQYFSTACGRKPFDKLPMPPGNHWLFGHVPTLTRKDFHAGQEICASYLDEQGRLGYWTFRQRNIMVTDWKDVRTILLKTDYRNFVAIFRHYVAMVIGARNFLVLKGREWKFHRSAVLKSFAGTSSLANQKESIMEVAQDLVRALMKKYQHESESARSEPIKYWMTLDVDKVMAMVTIDAFFKAAIGANFQCCKNLSPCAVASAFDFMGSDFTRRLETPLGISNYFFGIPTANNLQYQKCRRIVRSFLDDAIQQRMKEHDEGRGKNDILSFLLLAHEEIGDKEGFVSSHETLRDAFQTLLFAGYDTTSICLTMSLYLLAGHPAEQLRCAEEVQRLLAFDGNQDENKDECDVLIDDLVFCKAVILETLRLYPPAFSLNRYVEHDLVLHDGFIIPAGTNVLMPFWTIHRMERNFSFANKFYPERWARQAEDGTWLERSSDEYFNHKSGTPAANHHAFFAFSSGSRSCPGQKFAIQEAVLVLAKLVHAFEFESIPDHKLDLVRRGLFLFPEGGLPLRLAPRKAKEATGVTLPCS